MHELSTMIHLVNLASEAAQREGGGRISSMEVSVGGMSGILGYYLKQYFPEASKGTAAEGAQLIIHEVPVRVHCLQCGMEYEPDREHDRVCPQCHSASGKIIAGRDVVLDSIELTEPDI